MFTFDRHSFTPTYGKVTGSPWSIPGIDVEVVLLAFHQRLRRAKARLLLCIAVWKHGIAYRRDLLNRLAFLLWNHQPNGLTEVVRLTGLCGIRRAVHGKIC